MRTTDDRLNSPEAKIAAAATLGAALTIFGPKEMPIAAFALFDGLNTLRDGGLIGFERLVMFCSILLFGFRRPLFLIGTAVTLVAWLSLYSILSAFPIMILFTCLFGYFALYAEAEERRQVAGLMLSLTFVLAAIQKMNPSYLQGYEFSKNGLFFQFLYTWGIEAGFEADLTQTDFFRSFLPIFSIVIELALGIMILIRPSVFAHVAMLFLLTLALVHPPVLYVYGVVFPLVIVLDKNWAQQLASSRLNAALISPFFWAIFIYLIHIKSRHLSTIMITTWPLIVGLLVYHTVMIKNRLRSDSTDETLLHKPKLKASLIPPALMILSFVAFHLGAPAPLGFSMFSAQDRSEKIHWIDIANTSFCRTAPSYFSFPGVGEARLTSSSNGFCSVGFPTESGMRGIKKAICRTRPHLQWIARSPAQPPVSESCP